MAKSHGIQKEMPTLRKNIRTKQPQQALLRTMHTEKKHQVTLVTGPPEPPTKTFENTLQRPTTHKERNLNEHLAWQERVKQLKTETLALCEERARFHQQKLLPLKKQLRPLQKHYTSLGRTIEHKRKEIFQLIE